MEVILGREHQSNRLCVTRDGKTQLIGHPGSVPMDVSGKHVSFSSLDNGKWELRNLNPLNCTFVNDMAVEKKIVSEGDRVQLGASHYLIQWDIIKGPKVETVDIRPLEQVWEWYEKTNIEEKEKERKTQNWQRLAGLLSSAGILFMFVESMGNWRILCTALSLLIGGFFFVRGFSSDSSLNIKLNDLEKEFRQRYTCPKCGHFMGKEPYDILIQNDGCKHCKAKFIK